MAQKVTKNNTEATTSKLVDELLSQVYSGPICQDTKSNIMRYNLQPLGLPLAFPLIFRCNVMSLEKWRIKEVRHFYRFIKLLLIYKAVKPIFPI